MNLMLLFQGKDQFADCEKTHKSNCQLDEHSSAQEHWWGTQLNEHSSAQEHRWGAQLDDHSTEFMQGGEEQQTMENG